MDVITREILHESWGVLLVAREAGVAAEAEKPADPTAGMVVVDSETAAGPALLAANGAATFLVRQLVGVLLLRHPSP
jgi:hypothetical protein